MKHVKRNETRQISQSKLSSKLVIDINDKNIFNLKKLLTNADWDPVYNKLRLDDTCQAFKLFLDIIRKAIDETFRAVKSKKRGLRQLQPRKEWVTCGLAKSSETKSILYRKFLSTKSPIDKEKYVAFRNKLNSLMLIAKQRFYKNKLDKNVNNQRQIWNIVNK